MNAYIIGQSGTGKTTHLVDLFLAAAQHEYKTIYGTQYDTVCFLDPDGHAIDRLALTKRQRKRVVFFDPTDPKSFNPLQHRLPISIVGDLASLAGYDDPRANQYYRDVFYETGLATIATIQQKPSNLGVIPKLLTNGRYRTKFLKDITDTHLTEFWAWFDGLSDKRQDEQVRSFLTTINLILADERVRSMFQHPNHAYPVPPGSIVLARLPLAELGERTVGLVGSLFLAQLQATVPNLAIFVDDIELFSPSVLARLFARGRKTGIAATFANRTLADLSPALQATILGNAHQLTVFRVSKADAERLNMQVGRDNNEPELFELPPYTYRTF